ncbi:glycosyltransferase family 39 protein [Streptococcus cristatus]|uniref:glycosyltransferase family 39 protein n=1 Tax=Streptococcus cristatus TaxID=45634 RepID=UPI002284F2E8|nr:glycosyltransferase family 39 protein [Streptococcus cristatus]MCY7217122.1 glycosyltransferase family 39 protein [Streptococcus cristatus]
MSKIYHVTFSILQKIMLVLSLHWLFTAIGFGVYLAYLNSLALILFGVLAFLAVRYRFQLKESYHFLMRHKLAIAFAALLFQLIMLLSAELLIRRDAAVVFTGAFKYLKESSISSYLTRNPNNLPLFLYERFFFNLFGEAALWIMQGLNLFYVNIATWILYKGCQRYFSQATADAVFSLYVALVGFSPYYMSMYTDIPPLPLISLQIFLALGLLKNQEKTRQIIGSSFLLGILTSLAFLIRPTVMILMIAVFGVLFLRKNWKKFFLTATVFGLGFSASYLPLHYGLAHQTEVPIIQGKGLAKGPLLFINLGLTNIGHDQEDMKEGLLQYVDPDKRDDYNNGMFATENVIKEIKRRLKEYTPLTFLQHLYYKQSLTVAEGNLGWLYRSVEHEKTPYISPLYESTKDNAFTQFIRDFFLNSDKDSYRYYSLLKQVVWIIMALGLVFALWKYRQDDSLNFLILAVFGGLLFLQIFEGGKTRYLIQFLPQILILSAVGLAQYPLDLNRMKFWKK